MQSLNKDILNEYLDSQLQKGLIIKFSYDPKLQVAQRVKIINNAVDQFNTCRYILKNSMVHGKVGNYSCQPTKSRDNKSVEKPVCDSISSLKCKSRSLKTSRAVYKSPLARPLTLSPSNCKGFGKYKTYSRSDTNLVRLMPKVKQGTAKTCMVTGGNGDEPFRRQNPKHKESVYVRVNNQHETCRNTRFKREMKVMNAKIMSDKHKGNNMHVATQCNYKAKQRNVFSKVQGTSNKYRATLKQMLEKPNTKNNIIGPIPIRAEGINELTKRIEQLVQESGDGVVQKKLRLCKQGHNSLNSCLELDVNIRKISFEEIAPRVHPKQKARSIFSPFNCFSARPDSEDHIDKHVKNISCKPKRAISKISMTQDGKAKTSWRMNIPFFERFRLNPKYCSVKILECGPVPIRGHCERRVCSSRAQSKRVVKSTSSSTSGTLEMSLEKFKPVYNQKGELHHRGRSVDFRNKSRGTNNPIKISRDPCVNVGLNFSSPIQSKRRHEKYTRERTVNSNRTRLSAVVCREIYLTPTDCDDIGFNNDKTRHFSETLQKHENACESEEPKYSPATLFKLPKQKDNCALYRWTASLKYLFERFLDRSFQKSFEGKINFIDPRELEKCITKKFEINENFVVTSFIPWKTNFNTYLTSALALSLPGIFSWNDVKLEPFLFRVVDISVHLNDHDMKYVFKQLTFKSAKNQERTSLCEKELKSVFYNNSNATSEKGIKLKKKKGTAETPKLINNYTVNNRTPTFQKLRKALPKWPRSNVHPSSFSKGAGGDKVSRPVVKTNLGKPVKEPKPVEINHGKALKEPKAVEMNHGRALKEPKAVEIYHAKPVKELKAVNNGKQLNQSNVEKHKNHGHKMKRTFVTGTLVVKGTNTTSSQNTSNKKDIEKTAMSSRNNEKKQIILADTPNTGKQPIIATHNSSIGDETKQSVAANTKTDANKSNQYFIGTNIITINDTNTKQSIINTNKPNSNKLKRFVAKSFTNARLVQSKKIKRYVIETDVSNVNRGNELDIKTRTMSNDNKKKQSVIETMGLTSANKVKRYIIETNMNHVDETKQCATRADTMENFNSMNYSVGINVNKDFTTGLADPNVFLVSMDKPVSRNKKMLDDVANRLNSRRKEILKKLGKMEKKLREINIQS